MGMDFEIVAYRGTPASTQRLAGLIARFTPHADLFRHAIAGNVTTPLAPDMHLIAFYDDERRDAGTDTAIPDSALAAASESAANGGSLADIVKQAWSLARAHEQVGVADAEHDCAELARELSRGGEAFLLGYADHSCIGIYAQFRDGVLVSPATIDDIYADHEDHVAWPSQQWSQALGEVVDLDTIVARYFSDASEPPMCRVRSKQTVPFDADRYSLGLSESM